MSTLGKAVIEFSADTARFTGDVGKAAAGFDRAMAQMTTGVANLRAGLVAAAGAGGIVALVQSSINLADETGKLANRLQMTTEQISELAFAAKLANVDRDTLTRGLKDFNLALVEARDESSKAAMVFKAMGVDITKGPHEAFLQFAEAFSKLEKGELKVAAANEILKKSGNELINVLDGGRKGFEDAGEKARRLGIVISDDFAKQAAVFNDSMTVLITRSQALGIAITQHGIGGLSLLISNLAEAAEKGNLLTQSLLEAAKIMAVLLSKNPVGFIAKRGDELAEFLFTEEERQRNMRGGVNLMPGGRVPAAGGGAAPPPETNTAMLACAVSGGKWINGKCVRQADGDAKRAQQEFIRDAVKMAEEAQAAADELIYTWDGYGNRITISRDELKKLDEGVQAAIASWVESAEIATQIAESMVYTWDEAGNRIEITREAFDDMNGRMFRETQASMDAARQLGMTFSSAFEDAALSGAKLSDVLRGLGQDIARIVLRMSVTQPLAAGVMEMMRPLTAGLWGSSGNPSSAGYSGDFAFADGGRPPLGRVSLVGEEGPELFVPDVAGQIVPNHELGGIRLDHSGPIIIHGDGVTKAEVRAAVVASQKQTLAAVQEMQRR